MSRLHFYPTFRLCCAASLTIIVIFTASTSCFPSQPITEVPRYPQKSSWLSEASDNCHPLVNPEHLQYIIGYGSLMKQESKRKTAPTGGPSIPIRVNGYSREWNAQGPTVHMSTTYLGVVKKDNSSFNAVVFQLNTSPETENNSTLREQELGRMFARFDLREDYYCRQKVNPERIIPLASNRTIEEEIYGENEESQEEESSFARINATGIDIWMYVNRPDFSASPNEKYPIVESYVDIFIAGCLQIEEQFHLANYTNECIQSTKGWESGKWVNDRIYPRRAFLYQPKAYQIDKALARNVPEPYNNIVIEGK